MEGHSIIWHLKRTKSDHSMMADKTKIILFYNKLLKTLYELIVFTLLICFNTRRQICQPKVANSLYKRKTNEILTSLHSWAKSAPEYKVVFSERSGKSTSAANGILEQTIGYFKNVGINNINMHYYYNWLLEILL